MTQLHLIESIQATVETLFEEQIVLLERLVAAKSANPYTPERSDPHDPVEREVADILIQTLKDVGVGVKVMGASKERPNVVGLTGKLRSRKSIALSGHMDTVMPQVNGGRDPFLPIRRGDRLYGLGVLDMKASLAAMVFVARVIQRLKIQLGGKLWLIFSVDEEPGACSTLGTRYVLNNGVSPKAAIVTEPGTHLGLGHRGGYRFKLTTKGESAHTGSGAWQKKIKGKNAIVEMMRVVKALNSAWDLPFKAAKAFPGKKPVFTFPTLISGGRSINVVPDKCEAYGDVRLMPGNSDRQVRLWIEERLQTLGKIDYAIEDLLYVPAVETEEKDEVVEAMVRAYSHLYGTPVLAEGIGPWNDGWMFVQRDIPTIVQVPLEGAGAHSTDEWVSLSSLKELTVLLTLTVVEFLGMKRSESFDA